jgi:hypothetical protein
MTLVARRLPFGLSLYLPAAVAKLPQSRGVSFEQVEIGF